jgi:hypothetical protein
VQYKAAATGDGVAPTMRMKKAGRSSFCEQKEAKKLYEF